MAATISGLTVGHQRAKRMCTFHRCAACGVLTHWITGGEAPHMGVHMENFDRAALADVPVVVDP